MKYSYPIRKSYNDRYYGKTDSCKIIIENICSNYCIFHKLIEASDCFRNRLLKNKAKAIDVDPVKCCFPKCPNPTMQALNFGYDFQFNLCANHSNKTSAREICGFGFPLLLRDFSD